MKRNHKIIFIMVFLIALAGYFTVSYSFKKAPSQMPAQTEAKNEGKQYSDYHFNIYEPEFDAYTGIPAKPDFSSNPSALEFKTRITDGSKVGPNFDGKFTFIEWGCGTSCQGYALVDAISGKIYYKVPFEASYGLDYNLYSNLIIVNPIQNYFVGDGENPPDWLTTDFWDFKDGQFTFLASFRLKDGKMVLVHSDTQ